MNNKSKLYINDEFVGYANVLTTFNTENLRDAQEQAIRKLFETWEAQCFVSPINPIVFNSLIPENIDERN